MLNESLSETYHSVHGAVQESVYVFIKNGLLDFIQKNKPKEISVLEIGFGTGLNALLALKESVEQKTKIYYTSIEASPIGEEIYSQLNYAKHIIRADADRLFKQLHSSPWNLPISVAENFVLKKIQSKIQEIVLPPSAFDIVFFDAFAPAKQPEMWELPVLTKVVLSLKPKGEFVTYCAQGQLKRNLKSLGLIVETLPGPPGKREMVRALK